VAAGQPIVVGVDALPGAAHHAVGFTAVAEHTSHRSAAYLRPFSTSAQDHSLSLPCRGGLGWAERYRRCR
jgi:hypothetical protein